MRTDPDRVETRRFEYRMTLTSREGRTFSFVGFKLLRADARHDLGADTTTLYVDIAETTPGSSSTQARGILKISLLDFARQLSTIRGKGGTAQQNLSAVAKFGTLFAGSLFDVYGGLFRPSTRYDAASVRQRRELRTAPPQRHEFATADGKTLVLTRYEGGRKGPLLFTHGLGVSSQIFTIDTIDTNLLEAMYAAGYDCWLLDYRASTDLPYCRQRWTADDCARNDYQPAVDLIRGVTGAASVQVIAHCFGATTFVMSLLGRHLDGVRAAVISQIATDVVVPWFPQRLLAYLRAPALFDVLGIDAVNARATKQDGLNQRIVDALIRLFVPIQREERVRSATSRRITALYGQLYETDQLNDATFSLALAEMFGPANIDAFKHLALMARRQTIVDASGKDVYLPSLDRMAVPICFIHGGENACFAPESTWRTLERLKTRNSAELYERHVIPNYGHIDCIFGKRAAIDVYPLLVRFLDQTSDARR
jgi:cholesterol oxidase